MFTFCGCCYLILIVFETGSHASQGALKLCVSKVDLEYLFFLPPLEGWDYRYVASHLVSAVLGIQLRALWMVGKHSSK